MIPACEIKFFNTNLGTLSHNAIPYVICALVRIPQRKSYNFLYRLLACIQAFKQTQKFHSDLERVHNDTY